MPISSALEPGVAISLWINAAKAGMVSTTDAANACEVITSTLSVSKGSENSNWQEFVSDVCQSPLPVVAVLPVHGNLRGVPPQIFTQIDFEFGVVAINDETLLISQDGSHVGLVKAHHKIVFPDAQSARRQMAEAVLEAEEILTGLDLVGSRVEIDDKISETLLNHIPPIGRHRDSQDLHSAFRMRLVIEYARHNSVAMASPSGDLNRLGVLNRLEKDVVELILAIASKVPN